MEQIKLPLCDTSNPADLESWFGQFGYEQNVRDSLVGGVRA